MSWQGATSPGKRERLRAGAFVFSSRPRGIDPAEFAERTRTRTRHHAQGMPPLVLSRNGPAFSRKASPLLAHVRLGCAFFVQLAVPHHSEIERPEQKFFFHEGSCSARFRDPGKSSQEPSRLAPSLRPARTHNHKLPAQGLCCAQQGAPLPRQTLWRLWKTSSLPYAKSMAHQPFWKQPSPTSTPGQRTTRGGCASSTHTARTSRTLISPLPRKRPSPGFRASQSAPLWAQNRALLTLFELLRQMDEGTQNDPKVRKAELLRRKKRSLNGR